MALLLSAVPQTKVGERSLDERKAAKRWAAMRGSFCKWVCQEQRGQRKQGEGLKQQRLLTWGPMGVQLGGKAHFTLNPTGSCSFTDPCPRKTPPPSSLLCWKPPVSKTHKVGVTRSTQITQKSGVKMVLKVTVTHWGNSSTNLALKQGRFWWLEPEGRGGCQGNEVGRWSHQHVFSLCLAPVPTDLYVAMPTVTSVESRALLRWESAIQYQRQQVMWAIRWVWGCLHAPPQYLPLLYSLASWCSHWAQKFVRAGLITSSWWHAVIWVTQQQILRKTLEAAGLWDWWELKTTGGYQMVTPAGPTWSNLGPSCIVTLA